jgi:hypothetical protein
MAIVSPAWTPVDELAQVRLCIGQIDGAHLGLLTM